MSLWVETRRSPDDRSSIFANVLSRGKLPVAAVGFFLSEPIVREKFGDHVHRGE